MVLKKKSCTLCIINDDVTTFLVVRIDLNQTSYEVVEDAGSNEVCATLSGPGIERELMVLLITSEDTAQGI